MERTSSCLQERESFFVGKMTRETERFGFQKKI